MASFNGRRWDRRAIPGSGRPSQLMRFDQRACVPNLNSGPGAGASDHSGRINALYDRIMYEDISGTGADSGGYHNYGYWLPGTADREEAGRNLLYAALDLADVTGDSLDFDQEFPAVLDVACGMGATTAELARLFPAAEVVGINISEKQLATCRATAPYCEFLEMSATDMELDDSSFDLVVCIEAAFHFDTREDFLAEALRVLRPGGSLALSDVLVSADPGIGNHLGKGSDRIKSQFGYRRTLFDCGFVDAEVVDVTSHCWGAFLRWARRTIWQSVANDGLPLRSAIASLNNLAYRDLMTDCYLLAAARKPWS